MGAPQCSNELSGQDLWLCQAAATKFGTSGPAGLISGDFRISVFFYFRATTARVLAPASETGVGQGGERIAAAIGGGGSHGLSSRVALLAAALVAEIDPLDLGVHRCLSEARVHVAHCI